MNVFFISTQTVALQPTSYLSSFSKNTRGSVQIDPDDSSESSDYLAHIYQPLQD
jgi:hypothetical protein